MPMYNDDSALAVLFRITTGLNNGLYVVATTDEDLARVYVAERQPRRIGHGPARYEPRSMTDQVRKRLLACGFTAEQLIQFP